MSARAAMESHIADLLRLCGFRLFRIRSLQHPFDRRAKLLQAHKVDLVIDVGANIGQYGATLRKVGYRGRIVSFEPMRNALDQLVERARNDGNWQVFPFGLGEAQEFCDLNVSLNSISSSVLSMLSTHEIFSPTSQVTAKERIEIRRLDDVFEQIHGRAKHVWLKIDVQGFEDRVFKGAQASLPSVEFVQVELSLRPLYDSQLLHLEIMQFLASLGFELIGVEPGFQDRNTGELLQMDGIFKRSIASD